MFFHALSSHTFTFCHNLTLPGLQDSCNFCRMNKPIPLHDKSRYGVLLCRRQHCEKSISVCAVRTFSFHGHGHGPRPSFQRPLPGMINYPKRGCSARRPNFSLGYHDLKDAKSRLFQLKCYDQCRSWRLPRAISRCRQIPLTSFNAKWVRLPPETVITPGTCCGRRRPG